MRVSSPSPSCVLLGVAAVALLCGCGRKLPEDFHVYLQDAKGLSVGSAVQWRGLQVGQVSTAAMDKGKVRLGVNLTPEHKGRIRLGVKAKASRGFLGRGQPVLELYGGSDASLPNLPNGAEIPEAGFAETLSRLQVLATGTAILLLALLYLILKGIRRIVAIAVAVLFLVLSAWFLTCQWKKHGADLVGPEIEARVNDLAHEVLTSPEAQAVWESLRGDLTDGLSMVRKRGDKAMLVARDRFMDSLQKKATELEEQGRTTAAGQIQHLKTRTQELLCGPGRCP